MHARLQAALQSTEESLGHLRTEAKVLEGERIGVEKAIIKTNTDIQVGWLPAAAQQGQLDSSPLRASERMWQGSIMLCPCLQHGFAASHLKKLQCWCMRAASCLSGVQLCMQQGEDRWPHSGSGGAHAGQPERADDG